LEINLLEIGLELILMPSSSIKRLWTCM